MVKAFLDAGLMPRVISGTSAGGVVAAMVCTRTDAELKRMLTPELARRITAFEEPFNIWFKRFWTTGARFDAIQWAKKVGTDQAPPSTVPRLIATASSASSRAAP